MATAMSIRIDEILQCGICQERLTDPKILNCQHSFCCQCLDKWWKSKNRQGGFIQNLSCPNCRSVTTLPAGGVSQLKSDLTQKMLADVLTEPQSPLCEVCIGLGMAPTQRKADHFCKDCNSYMCNNCAEAHKKLKLFREHSIFLIAEKEFCQQHPLKRKDFYCEKCDFLLCSLCITHGHQAHQDSLHDARKYSEDMAKCLKELESEFIKMNQLPDHLKDVCKDQHLGLKKIIENIATLQAQVSELADSAVMFIEMKRTEINSSLEKAKDAVRKRQIWAEGFETVKRKAEKLVQKYHTYLKTGKPTDLLVGFRKLNHNVQTGIRKYSKEVPSLDPHQLPVDYLQHEDYLSKCKKQFSVGTMDNDTDTRSRRLSLSDLPVYHQDIEYEYLDDYESDEDNYGY